MGEIGHAWRLFSVILEAVEPLIEALEDEEWRVRWTAALTLAEIGDGRAVEPLIKALGDDNDSVRENVKEALKQLGHEVE